MNIKQQPSISQLRLISVTYGPRMRGVGWIVKDHTVRAGYWEMFLDGYWKSLMLIYTGDYKLYCLEERLPGQDT